MTLAFVTATESSAQTIAGAASIQAGDLLVLSDYARSGSMPSQVVPPGFVLINGADDAFNARMANSYKIADGSEASASLSGMAGDQEVRKLLLVFRDSDGPIATVNIGFTGQEATALAPSTQIVTSGSGTPPLVVCGIYRGTSAVGTRGMSPAEDAEILHFGSFNSFWLKYKIYNSSPADVFVGMTDSGFNFLMSFYLETVLGAASITPKMMHYMRLHNG